MIVQSFRSVIWIGAVAGAAIGCYMVSLRVASERAALETVEARILMAKRDIRALDTELSTRGRVRQLERWNIDVLALAAPTEGQFLTGEVQLASLTAPAPRDQVAAPVVLASITKKGPEKDDGISENESVSENVRPMMAVYKPRQNVGDDGAPQARNPLLVRASAPVRPKGFGRSGEAPALVGKASAKDKKAKAKTGL